jgi:NTP pyrophosphatase (non-canonical NTP hydrolase)
MSYGLAPTEEVGEVARIIARRYGEQSEKEKSKEFRREDLPMLFFVVSCQSKRY